MKKLIWSFIKIFFAITGIEILIFILMVFFVMTDEPIGLVGQFMGTIVKYVLGFPLVLINSDYPFFIDSNKPPNYMVPLVGLNLLLQTCIVILVKNVVRN